MNTDKYIGIPFEANGRTAKGLDCWGLVRLIYKDEYNINLPSFDTQYHIEDDARIVDLIAQYSEGWEKSLSPEPGDAVLFNVLGEISHIGVVVDHETFIHVREGSNCVLDKLTGVKWNKRIQGFYKYRENTGVVLNAVPHPLKTERVTVAIPEGSTLSDLIPWIDTQYKIDEKLPKKITFLVNSVPIAPELWSTTVLKNTDTVEYRAVLGKDVLRIALVLAVVYFAPQIAFNLGASVAPVVNAAGATIGYTATSFAGYAAIAAIQMVGIALVNVIAPVRPPEYTDPGTAEEQFMVSGAANAYTPYGSIPVVLGKVRVTPPLGSKSFARFSSDGVTNYLNMMLVWGYGPLDVDQTSIKVGEVDWDEYVYDTTQGGGRVTIDYRTSPDVQTLADFKSIYGKDVTQLTSGISMLGPDRTVGVQGGVSSLSPNNYYARSPNTFGNLTIDNYTGGYTGFVIANPLDDIFDQQTQGA